MPVEGGWGAKVGWTIPREYRRWPETRPSGETREWPMDTRGSRCEAGMQHVMQGCFRRWGERLFRPYSISVSSGRVLSVWPA